MKIHDKLDEILRHGSKIKILRFLLSEKDEYTGRGIAKAIGMSASTIHKTLQEMREERLISARKKGNAILYRLQEDNHIVKKLLNPLFEKEKSIYKDIVAFIRKTLLHEKKKIVSIAIFGSVVRKEETSKSDIDLIIIIKNRDAKKKMDRVVDKLNVNMAKKFGVAISPYILTKAEIKTKYTDKKTIIRSILNNNRLIYGEPIERILA